MSGVWIFKRNGVMQQQPSGLASTGAQGKRKVLVQLATGQAVSSYKALEQILKGLGWGRYDDGNKIHDGDDHGLLQFHKTSSIDLISLPSDFAKFNSIHMYDIVVKNPNIFLVRDII